jgi:LysM repeat protein
MKKRTSVFARLFAVLALVAAIVAVLVIVSGATDESSDKGSGNGQHQAKPQHKDQRPKAATYEIKPGDTLTRISHLTGIPVQELIALNPEVDPQILIEGEILKLR